MSDNDVDELLKENLEKDDIIRSLKEALAVKNESKQKLTRAEKELQVMDVLRDCGADSQQRVNGLERICAIVWGD